MTAKRPTPNRRTYDVQQFADDYGVGMATAYAAAARRAKGDVTATPFPVLRIGLGTKRGRLVIPAEPYDRVLAGGQPE